MATKSRLVKWYWIAGVVGTIIVSFALFEHSDKGSGMMYPGQNNAPIVRNQRSVILDPKAADANQSVDIVGEWNRGQAEAMAVAELEGKAWDLDDFDGAGPSPFVHKFVSVHSVLFKDRHLMVLTFQTAPKDYACRYCAPALSLFEFEERQGGWKLISSDLGVTHMGRFGEIFPECVSVTVIGENIYGVFLHNWDSVEDPRSDFVSIQAKMGGSYREILSLTTGESFLRVPDTESWSSTITTSPTSTGLYDLVVDRAQGDPHHPFKWDDARDGDREDYADHDGRIRPYDVFKFDGNHYVRSDVSR